MVFFTCNSCGTSLKKNQVEKHYQTQCRTCEVLSCIDCGKDFYGDDYVHHTKCISEAEKYQGALYQDGGGSSKGEKKQHDWLERVKQSTSKAKVTGRVAVLLERISEYPNIPRKRKKFENFVRNSINIRDANTLSKLWDAFSGTSNEKEASMTTPENGHEECTRAGDMVSQDGGNQSSASDSCLTDKTQPLKKSKVKDQDDHSLVNAMSKGTSKKCKRKKSSDISSNGEVVTQTGCMQSPPTQTTNSTKELVCMDAAPKKKKKHKNKEDHEKTEDVSSTSLQVKKKKKRKHSDVDTSSDSIRKKAKLAMDP